MQLATLQRSAGANSPGHVLCRRAIAVQISPDDEAGGQSIQQNQSLRWNDCFSPLVQYPARSTAAKCANLHPSVKRPHRPSVKINFDYPVSTTQVLTTTSMRLFEMSKPPGYPGCSKKTPSGCPNCRSQMAKASVLWIPNPEL
jgi:hypothetical protein